ncbi:MAG: flagellar hook-associated protein FlgL [Actinomycetaceae bacterium]|nr:flagellar hook-associated protein FlgL [Actinomycetaceae bacterium]
MMERITQTMLANASLYNIQKNTGRMAMLNEQQTSGKRMQVPSDDPASSVDAMRLRNDIKATEQYGRNTDDAAGWMQTVDTALQGTSNTLKVAREKMIAANSGAMGPTSHAALAEDLRAQAEALMNASNSTYLGRTVFAGNSDKGITFTKSAAGVFTPTESDAVTAQDVTRRLSVNHTIAANADGNKIFGTGTVTYSWVDKDGAALTVADPPPYPVKTATMTNEEYKTLTDKYATDLKTYQTNVTDPIKAAGGKLTVSSVNNPNIMNVLMQAATELDKQPVNQDRLDALQNALNSREEVVLTELASLGAKHKVVLERQESVKFDRDNLAGQLSGVEDVDLQKTIIDMALAEMSYKASLDATQRVIQPSLLDYLR